jgi:hypothetical protein
MGKNNDIGLIPDKEVDTATRMLFLKTCFKLYLPFFILSFLVFGFLKGLFVAAFLNLITALIVMFLSDKISNVPKTLYTTKDANISVREQMQGTLKSVKVLKMNKQYKQAPESVNNILLKDPDFHDALFVKSQILNEDFNNQEGGKKCLKIVIDRSDTGQQFIHGYLPYLDNFENLKTKTINRNQGENSIENKI